MAAVRIRCYRFCNLNILKTARLNCRFTCNDASPLSGIRIIDLTRIVAGPFCTMSLGDLGAEILKIEAPITGDEARNWGPPFVGETKESCYFLALNRNKKSICVDLKSKEGRKIMHQLIAKSDVLVENYVPGKLSKFGLSYDQLKDVAPHLVYCSLTGYGPVGPYSTKPGYDVIAASEGGFLHITGPKNGEPCKAGVPMTDIATGLYALSSIMTALYHRTKTGQGQKIDCNLLSTQIACLINVASNYLNAGIEAERWGTAHSSIVPYEAFPTRDGKFITVGVGSDKQFHDLCRRIQRIALIQDKRFIGNENRVTNRVVLINLLRKSFEEKDLKTWLTVFEGATFPYGPINSMQEVFEDPHVNYIGLVKNLQHASYGNIKVVGPPVKFSTIANEVRQPPPTLGEHTVYVLKDILGFSEEKIKSLLSQKVIQ